MIGIALGFILIAALILWFIIGSKGNWGVKAALIILSLYFCLTVGFSVSDFMGWPTDEDLPEKFLVHWIVVDEPDSKSGDEGNIYVWLKDSSENKISKESWNDYLLSFYDGDSEPRSYKMPYSRDLHEQAQEALNMIMDGQSVGGTNSGLGQGEGEGEGDGEGGEGEGEGQGMGEGTEEGGEGEGSLTRNGGISFHKLPPAKLPRKN